MNIERFPIEVLDSMDAHIKHLKMFVPHWTIEELFEVQQHWDKKTVPKEYKDLIADEIKKREIRKG